MSDPSLLIGSVDGAQGRALQALRRKALEQLRHRDPAQFGEALAAAMRLSQRDGADDALTVFRTQSAEGPLDVKLGDLDENARRELGKLQAASEQLEALMVKQMLSQMRRSVPESPLDGPMGDLARDMLDQSMSEHLAQTGSVGLAPLLFNQLSQRLLQQEAARAARAAARAEAGDTTDR